MSYPNLASTLYNKLTSSEWQLVSYYINKADSLGKDDNDSKAREALQDAVAVAKANGEFNAAYKIEYYLRFY